MWVAVLGRLGVFCIFEFGSLITRLRSRPLGICENVREDKVLLGMYYISSKYFT